jgi:Tfp pilus assembly protein PilF
MSAQAPVRRNDPCPCGSGRRFKECHGRLDVAPPSLDAKIAGALQSHQSGNIAAAERVYREILEQEPAHAIATHYLGMISWQRGDAREGERLMRASIAANATIPDFHNNLGLLLRDARRTAEAIECYRRALEADPVWFEAYNNLGLALEDAGRFEEALGAYGAAIGGQGQFAAARQNLARLLVTLGRYAEGWQEYRWRLLAQGVTRAPPDPSAAPFPASLAGRRIALASEQGIGDMIFFLRFVPELVARGAVVSFDGDSRLLPILARTGFFAGGFGPQSAGTERVFIGDLPWLLGANDPSRFPRPLALSPLADRVAAMRARLDAAGPAPRIAITWRGGTATTGGPVAVQLKEIALDLLGHSLKGKSATWISIQRLPREGEADTLSQVLGAPVHDFSGVNDDLEDMLALLALVEGYVGVSNANTHLRAGVGGAMQVLVPFPPEWRWSVSGERSPWFCGMRVLRQEANGSWTEALEKLAAEG